MAEKGFSNRNLGGKERCPTTSRKLCPLPADVVKSHWHYGNRPSTNQRTAEMLPSNSNPKQSTRKVMATAGTAATAHGETAEHSRALQGPEPSINTVSRLFTNPWGTGFEAIKSNLDGKVKTWGLAGDVGSCRSWPPQWVTALPGTERVTDIIGAASVHRKPEDGDYRCTPHELSAFTEVSG